MVDIYKLYKRTNDLLSMNMDSKEKTSLLYAYVISKTQQTSIPLIVWFYRHNIDTLVSGTSNRNDFNGWISDLEYLNNTTEIDFYMRICNFK